MTATVDAIDAAPPVPAATSVSEAVNRTVVRICGRIAYIEVAAQQGPAQVLASIDDGTGAVEAVFMGRRIIPGIRPGKRTQDYIQNVTRRITVVGAIFLGVIAIVPGLVQLLNGILYPAEAVNANLNAASVLSGSGLIIVVGVVIDTMRQLEAQLVMRNYEGFMR